MPSLYICICIFPLLHAHTQVHYRLEMIPHVCWEVIGQVMSVVFKYFAYPPDTAIMKDNLPDLMNLLKPVSKKWKDIGLQLNIKQQALDDIKNNPDYAREGPDGFLRGVLNLMEPPTNKTLLSALRSPNINEKDVAQSIEELASTGQQLRMCHSSASH